MTSTEKTLRENDVKETAEIVYLIMKDQHTHHSFGTFVWWMAEQAPGVTMMGNRNMWAHVLRTHGALTNYETQLLWRRYVEARLTTDQRKGQAFMNALHTISGELYLYISDSLSDPFHHDHLLLPALEMLGIEPSRDLYVHPID